MTEETIFCAALEKEPQERAAHLDAMCGDDTALRRAVERLLAAHDEICLLDRPPLAAADTPTAGHETVRVGTRTGAYTLEQILGEGGMGSVWVAKQSEPVKRKVALKLIKTGMDSKAVVMRFEHERQALAVMDHPNIARVFDGGITADGRPFFVMELVNGFPLTKFCDEARLTPRQRLDLFVPVCQAVQHAHQKGIVHRDLKPSNILVTLCDGKPVPKVIDFGVAKALAGKLTDESIATQFGAAIGTLEYMAPEQAGFSALDIDTRADIYSLGVILYELLTGLKPIDGQRLRQAALQEMIRILQEEEPPRPSTRLSTDESLPALAAVRQIEPRRLTELLRGELDWIVMKCLEKSRDRRYESATALARDIQRFLADEPVEARPPSTAYRLRKLASKHKAALLVANSFVLLLVIGVVVSAWQAVKATQAERQMQVERDRAQMALTRLVVERLEGEMKQLAAVASTIERALAQREDGAGAHPVNWLMDLIGKDERIHGIALAYEPKRPDKTDLDCVYVYRGRTGIKNRDLLPPEYKTYLKLDWYRKPFDDDRAQWTGPGLDGAPGEQFWMISYSLPMKRNQKNGNPEMVGVLTVDLRMNYFQQVWGWLRELNLGEKSYGFVVNGPGITDGTGKIVTGVFVSHPRYDPGEHKDQPGNITDVAAIDAALAKRILHGGAGRETRTDPATGSRLTFLFHPVSSTGWSFVAVIEEQ